MLTIVVAATVVGWAVWILIPPASATRLQAILRGGDGDEGSIRGWMRRRHTTSHDELLAAALRTLSSELRAGSTPVVALERAGGDPSLWPHALAAARLGDRVEAAFALDAARCPDIADQLRQLAACWHVGVTRGSGLAMSVERLALSLRTQAELRAILRSELAAPRATGRMLALLPIIGIAMGYLLGADPLSWFLSSAIGAIVICVAVLLTVTGVLWNRRIVRRVERGLV